MQVRNIFNIKVIQYNVKFRSTRRIIFGVDLLYTKVQSLQLLGMECLRGIFKINFYWHLVALIVITLVSTVEQNDATMCIHRSPLSWTSFPFRSPQSTE